MTLSDWLNVIALLLSPLIALQVSRKLDERKERRLRKMWLFRTLMATRNARVSSEHVNALNSVDIEFADSKAVTRGWKAYLDHLNHPQGTAEAEITAWISKSDDLFVDLIYEMSDVLKFDFDKTHLKRSTYWPKAHGDLEADLTVIRKAFVEIAEGKRALPVDLSEITTTPQEEKAAELTRQAARDVLTGERPLRVKIERE